MVTSHRESGGTWPIHATDWQRRASVPSDRDSRRNRSEAHATAVAHLGEGDFCGRSTGRGGSLAIVNFGENDLAIFVHFKVSIQESRATIRARDHPIDGRHDHVELTTWVVAARHG